MMRRWLCAALLCGAMRGQVQRPPEEILRGREALAAKNFAEARAAFADDLKAHPGSVEAELGLADVELGLHRYEAAELAYRRIVAEQPLNWAAHQNLVIVEAALGRWEEFDRERAILRGARERGAAGLSARESDLIEAFDVRSAAGAPMQHWIVREYFEPVGRARARYNLELFENGKVREYVSLELGEAGSPEPAKGAALNWYTGAAHGTIATYPPGEPSYERVRADAMRWLRAHGGGKQGG